MPTNTTHYNLKKPIPGADDDDWGDYLNENWDSVDGLLFMRALKTANPKNYIVNPAMQISQQNGDTAGTVSGYYAADQWVSQAAVSPGAFDTQRIAVFNPSGTSSRLRMRCTTAKVSLAAGDFMGFMHVIEGRMSDDLGWNSYGAITPKPILMRFGWKSPAGTFTVAIRNVDWADKFYTTTFTVSAGQANTDTVQTLSIPAPGTDTDWNFGSVGSIQLWFTLAAGSNYLSASNGWQDGTKIAGPGQFNLMSQAFHSAELWDVEFYADPDGVGVYPDFVIPNFTDEYKRCQRYWQIYPNLVVEPSGTALSTIFPVPFRVAPTITGGGAGFTVQQLDSRSVQMYQTTRAYQTLTFNARM